MSINVNLPVKNPWVSFHLPWPIQPRRLAMPRLWALRSTSPWLRRMDKNAAAAAACSPWGSSCGKAEASTWRFFFFPMDENIIDMDVDGFLYVFGISMDFYGFSRFRWISVGFCDFHMDFYWILRFPWISMGFNRKNENKIWGFHKWGTPKWMVYNGKSH